MIIFILSSFENEMVAVIITELEKDIVELFDDRKGGDNKMKAIQWRPAPKPHPRPKG